MRVGKSDVGALSRQPWRQLLIPALLLVVFVLGVVWGSRGYHRIVAERALDLAHALEAPMEREYLPDLLIDMAFADYNVIVAQRESAIETGVYLSNDNGFVPAVMRIDGESAEIRTQLRQGPADALGPDDKWPFEIRVTSADPPGALPLGHFSLQDPAENNWLMQWAFSESLSREGFLTPRYTFVRLTFNGDYKGVYAVQEIAGSNLLPADGPRPYAIVGYDTTPLWEAIAHFQGSAEAALADPISSLASHDYRAFNVETYRYITEIASPEYEEQRGKAIARLYALQTGAQPASKAFDPLTYGRFLALVDLWGATEATSLINLKYYYAAESDRLQPIPTGGNPLASDRRLSLAAAYDDPIIQIAYVRAATEISDPSYLTTVREHLGPTWHRLSAAIGDELPDATPPWQPLAARQSVIRRSLSPIQPIFAYVVPNTGPGFDMLRIDVANRLNLPVEILGFDLDGATFVDVEDVQVGTTSDEVIPRLGDGVTLRAADYEGAEVIRYTRFRIPLADVHRVDEEAVFDDQMQVQLAVRLLGANEVQFVSAAEGFAQPLMLEGTP